MRRPEIGFIHLRCAPVAATGHTVMRPELVSIAVIYPGGKRYPLSEQVEAVPLRDLANPGGLFGER